MTDAESPAAKRVARNTLLLVGGSVITQTLTIVYVGILARYVGATGFGQISTATALVSLLILVVNFGLDTLLVRDVAADRERAASYMTNVALIRLVLTGLLAIVLAILVDRMPYEYETKIIIGIYGLAFTFDALTSVAYSIFHSFQRMEYRTIVEVGRAVVNVSLSLLGVYLGWSLIALVVVSAVANLGKLIAGFVLAGRRFARPSIALVDLRLVWRLFREAVPFFVLVCVSVAAARVTVVILSLVEDPTAVGLYSAALAPITALLVVPEMFYQSVLPMFSRDHRVSMESLQRSYSASFKTLMLLGFPMFAGVVLVSAPVARLLFGDGFEETPLLMSILAIQFFTMVGYANGAFLNATGRQRIFAALRVASVVLAVILALMLIPRFGAVGAALAVAIPALVDLPLFSVLCHRWAGLRLPWPTALRVGLSTAIMAILGVLALQVGVAWPLVVVGCALVYGLTLRLIGAVSAREWEFARDLATVRRRGGNGQKTTEYPDVTSSPEVSKSGKFDTQS